MKETEVEKRQRFLGWARPLVVPAIIIRGMGYIFDPSHYSRRQKAFPLLREPDPNPNLGVTTAVGDILVAAGLAVAVQELRSWDKTKMDRREFMKKAGWIGMGTAWGLFLNIADHRE